MIIQDVVVVIPDHMVMKQGKAIGVDRADVHWAEEVEE